MARREPLGLRRPAADGAAVEPDARAPRRPAHHGRGWAGRHPHGGGTGSRPRHPDRTRRAACDRARGTYRTPFVEPESRAGRDLRSLLGERGCASVEAQPGVEEDLGRIWSRPAPTDSELERVGRDVLERFVGPTGFGGGLDARIARVLDWLPAALECRASTADAAAIACLSESRFSHLFVEEVGLPFRTYLLWRRLMRAVERMSAGDSLTAAAHHAGFADSAHFSRTFHRMFGLPATALELTRQG